MKKLKVWNGRAYDCAGHLFIAAFSRKDCCDLANIAYRKINHYETRPDIAPYTFFEGWIVSGGLLSPIIGRV